MSPSRGQEDNVVLRTLGGKGGEWGQIEEMIQHKNRIGTQFVPEYWQSRCGGHDLPHIQSMAQSRGTWASYAASFVLPASKRHLYDTARRYFVHEKRTAEDYYPARN